MSESELKQLSLFQPCSSAFLEKLDAHKQIQNFKRGKVIFIQGDEAERFYLIRKGWVKLFRETRDGAQAIIDVVPAGRLFGEKAVLENDHHSCTAEVVEDAEIVSYSLADLKKELETDSDLTKSMLQEMARQCHRQEKELEHRSIQNAAQRIGCLLLRLSDQTAEGPVSIKLPYDKTLIAAQLGMQPETFSRALGKLREQLGLEIQGANIQIDDLQKLVSFSCSACSFDFPCKDLQEAAE